ncbi:division/cell wall cluster transcriptional repressor MraZ [Candidatus Thiothrix sp. Deng01]|uniref:Transcriptional regulator MraZ n=1 Tax=Candidatus Thiothrix phosphatis TaxID=3112415 RepID=A0ABU6CZ45_9GAMM|nr:division/cell wall cluster transcriptional repressor MraZ [Candidatus Thiothrix sp. Deng01]MEB4592106.1 division/cell wall cluster transcriptional repressor MraZ [Candidatus Thiothrix sp. Deng01]
MFRGISNISIDVKGRLAMPAKYRDDIVENANGQLVITIDHTDKCLLIYPMGQWVKVEKTLMSLPNMNRRVRNLQRLILGHAAELEMDSQGRVLLPAPLREYAGLDKKAVLVGQANKLELWDADVWEAAREVWLREAQEDADASEVLNQVSM